MRTNVEKLSDINRLIEEYKAEAELINRNQNLLGWEVTPFTKLNEIVTAKDPYEKLWNTAWSFYTSCEQWLNGPFRGLNAEAIGDEVNDDEARRNPCERRSSRCKICGERCTNCRRHWPIKLGHAVSPT